MSTDRARDELTELIVTTYEPGFPPNTKSQKLRQVLLEQYGEVADAIRAAGWLSPDEVQDREKAAWQKGSVHGAAHMANLQHANPYAATVAPTAEPERDEPEPCKLCGSLAHDFVDCPAPTAEPEPVWFNQSNALTGGPNGDGTRADRRPRLPAPSAEADMLRPVPQSWASQQPPPPLSAEEAKPEPTWQEQQAAELRAAEEVVAQRQAEVRSGPVQRCNGSNNHQSNPEAWGSEEETVVCLNCGNRVKFRIRGSDLPPWGRVMPHRTDGTPTR